MTLDEAINHAEEVAEQCDRECKKVYPNAKSKCANEHRQLAEWLKDYKRLKEQEPCNDCISRQAAIDAIRKDIMGGLNYEGILTRLPSVRPKERTGHWIAVYQGDEIINYRCSECEFGNTFGKNTDGMYYCPRCGARMTESR